MDCRDQLRKSLIQRLGNSKRKAKGVEGEPTLQRLKGMLKDKNPLLVVEAAARLALLGDRSGVPQLKAVETCTNSQIEYFYARAALTLLGEEIPPALEKKHSVFRDLEDLVRRCQKERVP